MDSIWVKNSQKPSFEALNKDIKTDVLIIGGGIAGILCAYMLKKSGVDCVLVEVDRICRGVTAGTTAKITFQHGLIYDKIINKYGVEAARMYLKANQEAIKIYDKLCKNTDCDYKSQDNYVYSVDSICEIEKELAAYNRIGVNADLLCDVNLPIKIKGALRVKNQAQFNPLKFCCSLANELKIYEKTKVIEVIRGGAITNRSKISAKKIIIATHFPFMNKYGGYFIKLYQHRSYVLALENATLPDGMYVDANIKGLSFREYNGKLLLGGGSHRTGKKGGNWKELREFADKYYPNSNEIARWATQDCMTLDSIPYIGRYSQKTPDLYVATGFNKWGMTSAMAAAVILRDKIMGKPNDYAEVFSPTRSIMHSQIAINAAETLLNFITPTVPRCPHLGCALKYNKAEHTWDCPCHGSRFTKEGKLIENPATEDKRM